VGATLLIGFVVSTSLYVRVRRATNMVATLDKRMGADRRLSTAQRLHAEGRYQATLAEIEANLLIGDVDARTRLLHAQVLFDLGRVSEAETHLQGLLGEEPQVAGAAHYLLARTHLGTDIAESREHRERAESLLPHNAEAYAVRALTAATPNEALQWLNQALQLDPSHYASRKARALIHYGLRDHTSMRKDVEAMIAIRPKDFLGYALRALAQRELGEMKEAISDHSRAIALCEIASELPGLLDQRQETHWRMGDYQAALQDAQRCVALAPERPAYRVAVGKILFKLGRYEAAKQEFDQILATGGNALWQGVRTMIGYAFDAASAGEPLEIPATLAEAWPFLHMPRYADLYAQLEQKATRLVRASFDISSWSPDGRQLAYTRSEFCGWDDNALRMAGPDNPVVARGIEILDLQSGRTRVLVTSGGGPAWSPDGQHIAFARASDMTDGNDAEIWLIPAKGGEARRLARGGYPGWTDHPTRLYFHSRLQEALCCIDVADPTAEPTRVAACPGWYPHVSPDERYLAYATNGELTVVELTSAKVVVKWVVPGPERYCCVRWSPDGKEISVSSLGLRDYCSGLWLFDFERRQGWHLLDSEAVCCNWSRDRSRVAIDLFFPVSEVWMAQVDPNMATWEALAPTQTRGEYLRRDWQEYVASYSRAWSSRKPAVLGNLTAMGVNQYDCGEYADALWTLRQVTELRQAKGLPPDIETSAHIAMALQCIGRRPEALEALHQLRRMYEQTEDPSDARLLYEAEQFIAGDNTKAH